MTRVNALLGFLLVSAAAAQSCGGQPGLPAGVKAGLYRGTVAGVPAVLRLGEASQYIYERQGLSIELKATQSGEKLILQESKYDAAKQAELASACMTLTPSSTGLSGLWTKAGQKVGAPVKLNRVDVLKLPLALPATPGLLKLRRDDPLYFVLLNHPWVKAASGRSVTEPLSKLAYLRLPGESAALNGALQDRQLNHVRSRLDCLNNANGSGDLAVGTTGLYLTPKLLSFVDGVEYDCGGAHPDSYTEGVILDRLTGEKVALSNIWYDLDAQKQRSLYLANLPASVDAECRTVLKEDASTYTANLTSSGLQLTPTDLPHVVMACAETATIPYAKLQDVADSSSVYYHDLYK